MCTFEAWEREYYLTNLTKNKIKTKLKHSLVFPCHFKEKKKIKRKFMKGNYLIFENKTHVK